MAVLVIVGIIVSFMTLSSGGDKHAREMEREAQRLVALLQMASDEAVTRSEQLAMRVGETDYEFMVLENQQWLPLTDDQVLRPRQLPDGIELRLELQDNPPPALTAEAEDEDQPQPQVFLLSSGEMTPFVLTFSSPGSEQRYHIKATLLGHLELE
jgi:general secretion pathway protein H